MIQRGITTFAHIWRRLSEPFDMVQDWQRRQQARLLASLLLAVALAGLPIALVPVLIEPSSLENQMQSAIGLSNVAVAFIFYLLARRGRDRLAAVVLTGIGSLSIAAIAFATGGESGMHALYFLSVIIVFSSLFLARRVTITNFIVQTIIMFAYGWLDSLVTVERIIIGVFILNLSITAITLLMVYHRERFEQAQQARLAESEARYRNIAELTADYAYSFRVEPDGTFTLEWLTDSPVQHSDYTPDDLDTGGNLQYYHPDDRRAVKAHRQAVLEGETRRDEYRLIIRDGSERWIQMYRRPICDENGGRVVRIFGVVQDITVRKQAETQRLQMALAKERSELMYGFFRQVAHDFRTSLAVVETSRYIVQKLLERGELDQAGPHLDQIASQVNRLTQQIENLRVVSLLTNPTTEPCDMNAIASAEIKEHEPLMATRNLSFAFVADPDVPPIFAHPKELQRSIGLLLENAIDYSDSGGSISLRVAHDDSQVTVAISDTGIGVEPEDEAHIFDFFYRAENAIAHDPERSGLGLSVARMVAEAYGGKIEVTSQPGAGSTFTLMIPTFADQE